MIYACFFLLIGVATVGGRIYIVGGNDGTAFLNTCEVYDPISDRWANIAPMNTARAGIGCAVEDGILYAAGKMVFKKNLLGKSHLLLSFLLFTSNKSIFKQK